jgi:hypothetical protein
MAEKIWNEKAYKKFCLVTRYVYKNRKDVEKNLKDLSFPGLDDIDLAVHNTRITLTTQGLMVSSLVIPELEIFINDYPNESLLNTKLQNLKHILTTPLEIFNRDKIFATRLVFEAFNGADFTGRLTKITVENQSNNLDSILETMAYEVRKWTEDWVDLKEVISAPYVLLEEETCSTCGGENDTNGK